MSAVTPTPHPLLQECADAISKVYFWDRHNSLRCAIDGRLALTTGLSEHLSESLHNAAVHGGELDFYSLSRVMSLLHRELQALDALFSVMCNDSPQQAADREVGP